LQVSRELSVGSPTFTPEVNAILSRIRELQSDLPPKARQIAALIIARPEIVVYMSMTDFSEACGVSEGTIVAFCRRVGASGFQELKIVLAQDLIEPVRFIQEDLHKGDDPATVTDHIFAAHAASLHETRRLLSTEALAEAVRLIKGRAKDRDLRHRERSAHCAGSLLPPAAIGPRSQCRRRFPRPGRQRRDDRPNGRLCF
jgi:hypothetical protein